MEHTELLELLEHRKLMAFLQNLDLLDNANRKSEARTVNFSYFNLVVECYKQDFIHYLRSQGVTKENSKDIIPEEFEKKHDHNTRVYKKSLYLDYIITNATPRDIINIIEDFNDYIHSGFYSDLT